MKLIGDLNSRCFECEKFGHRWIKNPDYGMKSIAAFYPSVAHICIRCHTARDDNHRLASQVYQENEAAPSWPLAGPTDLEVENAYLAYTAVYGIQSGLCRVLNLFISNRLKKFPELGDPNVVLKT